MYRQRRESQRENPSEMHGGERVSITWQLPSLAEICAKIAYGIYYKAEVEKMK